MECICSPLSFLQLNSIKSNNCSRCIESKFYKFSVSFFITMPSCSFSEALEIRYVEDIDANPIEPCEIFLVGSFPGRSSPSGRLVLPRTLTLNCCGIDRAGVLRKIDELCHDVEELDLAQNELSDLNEVDNILQHMPNLSFLNLSYNDMKHATTEKLTETENLRSLVLNCTYVPWSIVCSFLDAMPKLQELHLSLNDYSFVDLPSNKQYKNLKQLYICGNPLSTWNDLIVIGKTFPNLESLIMANTHIASIPEPSLWEHIFPNLQTINFNYMLLNDWKDIDRLNHFKKLEDIRLQGIPVLDSVFTEIVACRILILTAVGPDLLLANPCLEYLNSPRAHIQPLSNEV
ncbi:tubulin-specific chaperone cofactor E-like protein [Trichonephila clavipes]|nr:tubulin-specific chaperone cofactor E-like protein [Trichonephila clavipes]